MRILCLITCILIGFDLAAQSDSWDLIFDDDVFNVVITENNSFLNTRTSVYRSIDGGTEWNECNWPLGIVRSETSTYLGLCFDGSRLIVAALDNGYWISMDMGNSFSQTGPTGFGCASVSLLPLADGAVIGTMGGFQRGLWKIPPSPSTSWTRNFQHSGDQGDLQFGQNNNIYCTSYSKNHTGGILESTDDGNSWSWVFNTSYASNPNCFVIDENELTYFNYLGEIVTLDMTDWSVVQSIQTPWSNSGGALVLSETGTLFLSNSSGIFSSNDGGQTWDDLTPNSFASTTTYELKHYENAIYACTSDGLFKLELSTSGCTDPSGCNYSTYATEDDGSCTYADYGRDCNGNCAGATRWFVDATADPAAATGDTLTPFATIQAALDMACPSDTVLIAPGTYVENVSSTTENVTIRGYAPSLPIDEVAANVIIDGNALGTAFFISGDQTLLQDVTVQNGQSGYGAGLYLSGANGAIIQRCTIRDNVGIGDITAHGIALNANDCVIEDCYVTGNYGRKHTINTGGSNNVIRNCRIVDNNAWETGGGIVVYTSGMLIENCLIAGNNNGGVTTYRDDTVIDHCTIVDNTNFGCFIWCYSNDADFYITNSIIANNGNTEFTMVQTGIKVGTAHIRNSIVKGGVDYDWTSVYKVFDVDGSLNTLDPVLLSDYTLASTSSAIGTAIGNRYDFAGTLGTPSSTLDLDYAGRPQPVGTDADLGAMEHPLGTPEPTFGCTDDTACNYDPAATDDDASCIAPTCDDPTACNYDADATCGGGACIPSGCMEEDACNYNPAAQCAGQTCDYTCCPGPGCCDDPSQWDAALQQCNTAAPDTIVVTDTLLVPTPFCGAGTHWDPVTEMCIADVPGTVEENCTLMNLQDLAEGYQVLLDHTADQDSIILAQQAVIDSMDALPPCSCSEPVLYQGYSYDVVQIGDQCWFAENLRSESYRNGDPIPNYEADGDWSSAHQGSEGAWCHPNGDASKSDSYGHLYNHWLIMDGRKVCPEGWHVPSDADFIELEMFMGMSLETALLTDWRGSDQGTRLKASPTSVIPWDGTDEVGFRWVQGGWRHVSGSYGYVDDLGLLMFTPSAESGGAAYGIRQAGNQYQPGGLVRSFGGNAGDGRSLRCLKN